MKMRNLRTRLLSLENLEPRVVLSAASLNTAPAEFQGYIVVLNDDVADVRGTAQALVPQGVGELGFIYEHALPGFSADLPAAAASALAKNPNVKYVEPDSQISIAAQTVPTGIRRIFADDNANVDIDGTDDYRVDVDVAIIDTGIDFEHPDLNVVGGVNCSGGSPFRGSCTSGGDDDHFHGTHVAGTVAAIDNDFGVVGVAPGARLHAVKVLDGQGSGYISWIVAGVDWVAANAATIEVANMSLGGSGFSQAMYDAIQGAVNKGVAFAVAAGNSDADANNYSPAAFDNVLSVSALADFNGSPGGGASPTCRTDQDDTLADFSNWGSAVDIAAPGVCILSTYPLEQGEYGTISGTSMASPHAAGALALLASSNNPGSAADVHNLYNDVRNAGNSNWTDDSGDGTKEPLLDVSNTALFAPTLTAGDGGESETNNPPTASFTYTCTDLACDFDGSDSTDSDGSISTYAWDFGDGSTGTGVMVSHTYGSEGPYTVVLTVTDDVGDSDDASQNVSVSESTGTDTMHVGDLDGSVNVKGKSGKWESFVTVTVHDSNHVAVGGVIVTGNWSGTASGTVEGTTASDGTVTFSTGNLDGGESVTFTVDTVAGSIPSGNHDEEDADSSDGNSITMYKNGDAPTAGVALLAASNPAVSPLPLMGAAKNASTYLAPPVATPPFDPAPITIPLDRVGFVPGILPTGLPPQARVPEAIPPAGGTAAVSDLKSSLSEASVDSALNDRSFVSSLFANARAAARAKALI